MNDRSRQSNFARLAPWVANAYAACWVIVSPMALGAAGVDVVPIQVTGTIDRLSPESIVVKTAEGLYTADLTRTYIGEDFQPKEIGIPASRIVFDWAETPGVLKPGMLVKFEAEIDRGKAKGPVKEVRVINRFPQPILGVTEIHELTLGGDRATEPAPTAPPPSRFEVVGWMMTFASGRIVVEYPDPGRDRATIKLQARLTRDATVRLEDIMFAATGDHVRVKGERIKDDADRRFWATEIQVSREGKSLKVAAPKVTLDAPVAASAPVTSSEERADAKPTKSELWGKILKIN